MAEITCEVIYTTAPVPPFGIVYDWESGMTLICRLHRAREWIAFQARLGDEYRQVPAGFVLDEEVVRVLNIRLATAVKPTQDLRPHTIRR